MADSYKMRQPCAHCGHDYGRIERRGNQDCVFCAQCGKYARYNASRAETGLPTLSKRTRPDIPVSQRARILEADQFTCVVCHRSDVPLDVGHLLSVADGRKLGATDAELFSDENLVACCDACNSGMSDRTMSLRLVYRILQARVARAEQQHGETA